MENKDIVIIALILVAIYLYYQQNNQNIQPIENNNQIQELRNQVKHYQSLYQKRVAKDLDAETLNSEWEIRYNQLENLNNQTNREKNELAKYQVLLEKKAEDLETSLLNLAKQKLKGKKEAQRLLSELETQWKQDKENWQQEVKNLEIFSQADKIVWEGKVKELEELEKINEELREVWLLRVDEVAKLQEQIKDLENKLEQEKQLIVQGHNEQLKRINVLFDPNANDYETIDFNGLYSLLQQIAERERERERR